VHTFVGVEAGDPAGVEGVGDEGAQVETGERGVAMVDNCQKGG
jgi:hypothetical protein